MEVSKGLIIGKSNSSMMECVGILRATNTISTFRPGVIDEEDFSPRPNGATQQGRSRAPIHERRGMSTDLTTLILTLPEALIMLLVGGELLQSRESHVKNP